MDMQTPNIAIEVPARLSPALLNCLLRQLAAALPTDGLAPEIAAENVEAAREMFFAMQPRDAAEAAAAVSAVAAHFAAMDQFARATQPGLTDETVQRLRASAIACARAAATTLRALRRIPAAAAKRHSAPPPDGSQPALPSRPREPGRVAREAVAIAA
jgi:hypothetical protein